MQADELRTLWQFRPFQPFVIHLSDGREIPVRHPEMFMLAPNGKTAIAYQPDSTMNIVDVTLVSDLEVKEDSVAE